MKLHLSLDEKIIDRTIEAFEEVYPDQNKFIVILKSGTSPRFVKSKTAIFLEYGSKQFWNEIGLIDQYDSIILHTINIDFAKFVRKIKHNNVYWIEWGADLYVKMLAPRGYKLFYEEDTDWKFSHLRLPKLVYRLIKKIYEKYYIKQVLSALKYIKYFVPDSMEDEYPLLLSYYPELKHLKYRNFYYYPIDEVIQSEIFNSGILGNNIIVGNSASVSGNHLEVFKLLSKLNISKKVIVPLSYGNGKYADYVKKCGTQILGEAFDPITDFLPLKEYNNVLLSANVFIYPQYRQEAVGNILVALYLGGKVFLNKNNPLLTFYKKLGLVIFDMDDISENMINQPLSDDDVRNNREVLMKNYSKDLQLKLIRENF